jgi:hypothetical protein
LRAGEPAKSKEKADVDIIASAFAERRPSWWKLTKAGAVAGGVVKHPWTLAEDQSLREVFRQFATANNPAVWRSGTVVLPGKLLVSLDPEKDKPLAAKRDNWIKSQLRKSLPGQ